MKLILLFSIFLIAASFSIQNVNFNPTGTYKFKGKTKKRNGETYGYYGKIQVKQINERQIVMNFFICKGAPSYNSGSFIDTLNYGSNKAVYQTKEFDPSCKITFDFSKKGVEVVQESEDYNFGCGFGHAVFADGFFKKISKDESEMIDP